MFTIFAASYTITGGTTRLYAAGFFYACMLLYIYGSEPPCGALMRPLPVIRCKTMGKAEPIFIPPDKQFTGMSYANRNCLNAKNSTVRTTSAHETCSEFLTFIRERYPQLKYLKYKKSRNWYIFHGQWKRRKLYAHGCSPEYAMSRFLLGILRKVFTERLMTPEEYHAFRQELRRRVIMNCAVFELPQKAVESNS
jgi:hypothetical protein